MKEIYKKAYNEYIELVSIVRDYNGNLEELCDELGGFNLSTEDELFDLNYKSITATIYHCNGEMFVFRYIDIQDDEIGCPIKEGVDYVDLLDYIKE